MLPTTTVLLLMIIANMLFTMAMLSVVVKIVLDCYDKDNHRWRR